MVEDGSLSINMVATWVPDKFNITLFLGSDVKNDENLLISFDGGSTYQNYKGITIDITGGYDAVSGATAENKVTIDDRSVIFSGQITYGQSIYSYLSWAFKDLPSEDSLPILQDSSDDGTAQTFNGWKSQATNQLISGSSTFQYGDNGMLAPPANTTLADYQKSLHNANLTIATIWGVMSYNLTLPETMPTGWSLSYTDKSGEIKTINSSAAAGVISVPKGSVVTLTTPSTNPQNFSLWSFNPTKAGNGTKIFPTENEYRPSNPSITYTFEMPAYDVTAKYGKGKEIYIDIAKSPIMFKTDVEHNNRRISGFWYADVIDELTPMFKDDTKILDGTKQDGTHITEGAYFYQWNFSDKFCVTSNNVATKNQLTLVNALTGGIYLKDVNLEMREAYINNAVGNAVNNVDCNITKDSNSPIYYTPEEIYEKQLQLADCANIVVDNQTQQAYDTKLYFVGTNNIVGAIMPDVLRSRDLNHNNLYIYGTNRRDTAKLGTAFGNFDQVIENITINEYTKGNSSQEFNYLIYYSNWNLVMRNATIEAPHKIIYIGYGTEANTQIIDSTIDVYSFMNYYKLDCDDTYLRVRENLRLGWRELYLQNKSKVVVDGNVEYNYQHWSRSGKMTDGSDCWLIVKGNRCDLSNYTWNSGTLVCNALIFGRCGGITGGTVVTNQILSQPVGFWKYGDVNGKLGYYQHETGNKQTERARANNDNYPFTVLSQATNTIEDFTFGGDTIASKIYLLGYYKTRNDATSDKPQTSMGNTNNNYYDYTVKATDEGNPVKQFIESLYDATTGDIHPDPLLDTAAVEQAVKASVLTDKECVVWGNSTYNDDSRSRTVKISGNVEIYAAGNITFFNDTIVSGGKVYCNGSFGTKGDLTVSGSADITAETVGNAYNLTTTLSDGSVRWRRTDIQSGHYHRTTHRSF